MMRAFACLSFSALLASTAFSQSTETPPTFEAADVHVSPRVTNPYMKGPFHHDGTYELRTASMLDLIVTAYGVNSDKVYGGPSWLEMDRFDVIAKVPDGATPEMRKMMLQALLVDRFKLVVHNDTKPMPAYALTVGKKPQLKEADGSGETGCKPQGGSSTPGENGIVMMSSVNGATTRINLGPDMTVQYSCRNITMAAFAEGLGGMVGSQVGRNPVLDQTGLKGAWNFDVRWSLGIIGPMPAAAERISIFDAVDKQLGLKLEPIKVPTPVLVVDSANQKPTANLPDVAKRLPVPPTEFEVAEIKPSPPNSQGGMVMLNGRAMIMQGGGGRGPAFQNGRVNLQGYTLQNLIMLAWDLNSVDMLVGAPKWLDTDRFDVIAKVPGAGPSTEAGMDMDLVVPMLRALLIDRFKLAVHNEDRPVSAYVLTAAKPKLKPADPANRSKWLNGPAPGAKDPRDANPALGRLVTCQNMTMAQFAAALPNMAGGYIHTPVLDSTGLDGAWDFTLNFSGAGMVNGMGRRGGDAGQPSEGAVAASDPNGALSLFDAVTKQLGLKLEMQKRPIPVLVIDHVEQKPTEN
jgi:uncharacterized protein (TIGR03435 family)